ncbi:alpha-amylase family glycosyl hydrolase [Ideonella sp. DXS29W]|uniref:Alpha-amylase family glycosyl hydrolase n=1 Tax=Ideonella lacteola TaxID=2984193 RepID=A0ABU9BRP5_9BURK
MPSLAANNDPPQDNVTHVPWSRQAVIYEVNLRQYTPEGTIQAFAQHLPRLKAMGVDILWLMPVHPIGVKERKGTLGSYYASRDYRGVNPEFGTVADLRELVKQAHGLGMKVILDWVANHTAWDHPWVTQHPDWYKKNARGEIFPVTFGEGEHKEEWSDVVALDYTQPGLRQAMLEAMAFWVRDVDVDGFRCDVAGLVPMPFWREARATLDRIKPVFMLAEWDSPEMHDRAFDMTYDLGLYDVFRSIAKGSVGKTALVDVLEHPKQVFPPDAYRMRYTANHDSNSWQASDAEAFGPSLQAFAVLAATLPGMPLLYGGQEGGLDKRLKFFEKDPIEWKNYPLGDFYTRLFKLKHEHPALAVGTEGGPLQLIDLAHPALFAFQRAKAGDRVTVVVNLSGAEQSLSAHPVLGDVRLPAWGWRITTADGHTLR